MNSAEKKAYLLRVVEQDLPNNTASEISKAAIALYKQEGHRPPLYSIIAQALLGVAKMFGAEKILNTLVKEGVLKKGEQINRHVNYAGGFPDVWIKKRTVYTKPTT